MVMPSKQSVSALSATAQKAASAIRKQKKTPSLTPRQRKAISLMVFEGQTRSEAAKSAGMHEESLRIALTKTHVLAYLNEQQEVLRTSLRPRALRRIGDLIDKADSDRVRLDAAKYVDGMDRGHHAVGATQINVQVNNTTTVTPGYMVKLDRSGGAQIEHLAKGEGKALPHMQDVPEDD